MQRFLAPKWLAGHLFVLAAAITMVLLGRWQLQVSEDHHFTVQNFGYALQWWAFTGFLLVLWAKIIRDISRQQSGAAPRATPQPSVESEPRAYRSYTMPQSSTAPEKPTDSEHRSYNAYLARLARSDRLDQQGER